MISGIGSNSGYPVSFITGVKQAAPKPPAQEVQLQPERTPEEIQAPTSGDEAELKQEFMVLDLAHRQFSQMLPRIETANADV